MSQESTTPEARFATIVEVLRAEPDVEPPSDEKRFGSSGLKVHSRIFAMLVRGALVVKLPRARVDALVASGDGERYDPRRDGRLMREWVAIAPMSHVEWLSLAHEALAFVAAQR